MVAALSPHLTLEMRMALHIGFSEFSHLTPTLRADVFNILFESALRASGHYPATEEELIYQDAIRISEIDAERQTWDGFDRWCREMGKEDLEWEERSMGMRWERVLGLLEREGEESESSVDSLGWDGEGEVEGEGEGEGGIERDEMAEETDGRSLEDEDVVVRGRNEDSEWCY